MVCAADHRAPSARGAKARLAEGAILLAVLLVGRTAPAQVVERVLAVVNGEVVTQLDVRAAVEFGLVDRAAVAEGERAVTDALIDRHLMLADAGRSGAREPDEADLDQGVRRLRAPFESGEAFESALSRCGMTIGRLRSAVRDSIRLEAHLDQRFAAAAQPTDDEVARYYREHRDALARGGVVPALEAVRDEVADRVASVRRAALVSDWLERLRTRADIRYTNGPPRR